MMADLELDGATVFLGDCIERMRERPDGSVQMCVTSPPYYGLRDYGVDGQIGLEETPDEYIAKLVDVFREVRRLLADDGTCWVNIGDSYASGGRKTRDADGKLEQRGMNVRPADPAGIKQKDLIGIPWMLAKALRDPYYTGKIRREVDRVWLAAMVDGEGCFYIHKRQAGQHAGDGYMRKTDTYSPAFEVANTQLSIIEKCMAIAGVGSIIRQDKDRRQPIYRWTVRSDEARQIAAEIYPHLVAKQQQCRVICAMPNSGDTAVSAWLAMKDLHAGIGSKIDFPAPKSMWEPGWYLRQEIIWAKPNPMPESVMDRCTKSHESLFLLSKSAKYFYDAEAVKEPIADASRVGERTQVNYSDESKLGRKEIDRHVVTRKPTRNRRSVWTIATRPYKGAHFAVFPPALVEPCILAGSRPGDVVLDPFNGSGTTGQVALVNGRQYEGYELNPDYVELTRIRLQGVIYTATALAARPQQMSLLETSPQ